MNNIYVDNVISGTDTTELAIEYYKKAKNMFGMIVMNIREWYTNDPELRKQLASPDVGISSSPKVLGLNWDVNKDELSCSGFRDHCSKLMTKRTVLQSVSTLYDPCGFFCPITMRGKLLVQQMWKEKLSWDEPLLEPYISKFGEISADLSRVCEIKLPRLVNLTISGEVTKEIHCFCDASGKAYGAAIYLRSSSEESVSTHLIFSKVRLAPIAPISLPRLELMAAVVGVRLCSFVTKELALPDIRVVVWSDSKCVLHWIHSDKLLTTFVHNRIKEIKMLTSYQFRYVPTTVNPADIPSRGTTVDDLKASQLWWHGPKFLALEESLWPENEFEVPDESSLEEKKIVTLSMVTEPRTGFGMGSIVDADRFASLSKLLRTTAWVNRFIKSSRSGRNSVVSDVLTISEISFAKKQWIIYAQSSENIGFNPPVYVRKLGIAADVDGVIRCHGRMRFSNLSISARNPILLPENCRLTQLIVHACHEKMFHAGVSQTLAHLRGEFWLPHGRSRVKKLLSCCLVCRRVEGGPFKMPESPSLPGFRVSNSPPFTNVGVDYFGPLFVRNSTTSPPEISKVWICLFTCAVVRAVHLEVVTDNSTEQFILCLRRFASIYGAPKLLISDNATQFKAADDAMKIVVKSKSVQDFATFQAIDWKFIPAMSPWMGGFYERLVGTVKRSFRKVLGRKCLNLVQLQTLAVEVASVVNSRPLVPIDPDSDNTVLTPAHFLCKGGRPGIVGPEINNDPDYKPDQSDRRRLLLDMWKKGQRILEEFWQCWKKDYLANLRERPGIKLNERNCSELVPKPGVVVILKEPRPRAIWRMGRISKIHRSRDNEIRSVSVKLAEGNTVVRPLKLLCPIEDSGVYAENEVRMTEGPHVSTRPKRQAAKLAQERIQKQLVIEDGESEFED